MEKENIVVFDFDGTLTTCDTLLLFIRQARGRWALLWGLLLYSPLLVLMKLHLADNGLTKERFFGHFFKGMLERDFEALCARFAHENLNILRTEGMKTLQKALDEGKRVIVVSASVDRWVEPILRVCEGSELRGCEVLGTQIEVVDGRLTGHFSSPNCYGAEKVIRLKNYLDSSSLQASDPQPPILGDSHRSHYHITAYGDSQGDRELLAYADEAHYKPFRLS